MLVRQLAEAKSTIETLEDELRTLRATYSSSKSSSQVRAQQVAGYRDKIQALSREQEVLQTRNVELCERIAVRRDVRAFLCGGGAPFGLVACTTAAAD